MTARHRIIVSAENVPYLAWQAKLFYYSCVTRLERAPVIVVHESGEKWHSDFYDIVRAGGIVRSAPSYRRTGKGDDYAARNTPGTLLHAAELCEASDQFIVLCDTDMLFLRPLEFPSTLSGSFYEYMNYNQAEVSAVAQQLGIEPDQLKARQPELCCGAPYIIPRGLARPLALAWMEAIDAFPPGRWEISMYAFGFAVAKLGLKVKLSHTVNFNYWPSEPLNADLIHYGYGDDYWNKRDYYTDQQARQVWHTQVTAPPATVLAEILSQLQEATDFYRDPFFETQTMDDCP